MKINITLRLSQSDVLVVRKRALERLATEETRCDRLDGRIVEVVIQEYINWMNDAMFERAAATDEVWGFCEQCGASIPESLMHGEFCPACVAEQPAPRDVSEEVKG